MLVTFQLRNIYSVIEKQRYNVNVFMFTLAPGSGLSSLEHVAPRGSRPTKPASQIVHIGPDISENYR